MTEDRDQNQEERKKVYASTRQDLLSRNLSNSEKYDGAVLTLSTTKFVSLNPHLDYLTLTKNSPWGKERRL